MEIFRQTLMLFTLAMLGDLTVVVISVPAQEPSDVSVGKAIYDLHCQKCHGASGRGDGPQAQWQMVAPANFHSRTSQMKSDEQLLSISTWGIFFSPMHSWGDRLSLKEREEVLAYIRLLTERR